MLFHEENKVGKGYLKHTHFLFSLTVKPYILGEMFPVSSEHKQQRILHIFGILIRIATTVKSIQMSTNNIGFLYLEETVDESTQVVISILRNCLTVLLLGYCDNYVEYGNYYNIYRSDSNFQ